MAKRKLTRREKETRIREALAEVASTIGLGDPAMVKKQFQAFLSKPSRHKPEELLSLAARDTAYKMFKRVLDQCRTEKQLEKMLATIPSLKTQLPILFRKGLEEMKKSLPRHGGPGRGETLNRAQKLDACEQIASMQKTKAATLPDTFEAVAEAFTQKGTPVSARTIKRAWQQRALLYA